MKADMCASELLSIRPQEVELRNQLVNIMKAKGGKQRQVIVGSYC
ncbi:MAG: hypothetical protein WCE81_08130 [Halobacteriota archaeon]